VSFILDIPRFKCWVKKEFLTDFQERGFTEAYAFSVTLLENRPLLFTVHTVDGAVYSRLPIWALTHTDPSSSPLEDLKCLDPWGAISSFGQAIEHKYLKDYYVEALIQNESLPARYLFTIDYCHGGFAQDPEQHKTSNILALDCGLFAILPNNMCLFLDRHFTNGKQPSGYKRNKEYFTLG